MPAFTLGDCRASLAWGAPGGSRKRQARPAPAGQVRCRRPPASRHRVARRAGIRPGRDRRHLSRAAARTRPWLSARLGPVPRLAARHRRPGKSNALSWASVRRSPRRRPITATAKSRTALTATQPRPPAPPINSGTYATPALLTRPMPPPRPCCHRHPLAQFDSDDGRASCGATAARRTT